MTAIDGAVVLVTGGSRGLGRAFVDAAYARGAKKIYATARDPRTVTRQGVTPLALEATDPAAVARVAAAAGDVTILINNAAGLVATDYLDGDVDAVRREFETNFFGPLQITLAFAPVIEANGGGHVLNVASVLSWLALRGSYAASKAALWSMTNALRVELHPHGIDVTSLHVGYLDTDMVADIEAPKADPRRVADLALDGVEAGAFEVLADEQTRQVKAALSGDPVGLYPALAG
jgi:NAD(P)-dependent dehydrogenase (short-subunit alcohol dehydrogenase family)